MTQPAADFPALRWALIGASDIAATRMIPAMRAVGDTVTVVQSGSADWADEFARTHEIPNAVTDIEAALARPDVDAVYVSSHNDKHHAQVLAAAAAGKHVLAEKPLALNVADAQEMVQSCADAGVVMATNHHIPASPTNRAIRAAVQAGAIGEVRAAHVNHAVGLPERLQGWRLSDPIGGGVILDVFIHDMAALAAAIGGQALQVTAKTRPSTTAAPDSLMTIVGWTGDVIAQTHDAYDNFHLPTWFELLGTEGALRGSNCMTGDPVGEVTLFRDGDALVLDVGDRADLYVTTMAAFRAAVFTGQEPLVTGKDGVRSLAAAVAAVESIQSGQTVNVPVI
jgi:1,5-anhydro-D-fructose reductase (1,5-anhydro-D-mannitol-forming)